LIVQVDFNAKTEYECLTNYKVLQEVFTNLGIDKVRSLKRPIQDPQRRCRASVACVTWQQNPWQQKGQLFYMSGRWASCIVRQRCESASAA
jgi:hypothetical protein